MTDCKITPDPVQPMQQSIEESECKTEQKEYKSYRSQIIASCAAALSLISCGLLVAWPTIYLQDRAWPLDTEKRLWVNLALDIGACLGPILAGLLIDCIGRTWFLLCVTIPIEICWVLTLYSKTWVLLLVGRILAGISVGAIYTVIPIYNGEITVPRVRASAIAIMAVMFNVGLVFTYGMSLLVHGKHMAFINLAPAIIFCLTYIWMPESPYYYLKKQRTRRAEVSLTWLRSKTDNKEEMEEIQNFVGTEKGCSIKELYKVPMYRNALLVSILLFMSQQLSGYLIIQSYANTFSFLPGKYLPLVISGVILIGSIIATPLVSVLKRKFVFLLSAYGVALCLVAVGAYEYLRKNGMKLEGLSFIPIVVVAVYLFLYSFGLTSIPAIVTAEIFPGSLKVWAIVIANVSSFVIALIVTVCLHILSYNYYYTYIIFGVFQFILAIFVTILMPETSHKSFKEIQEILNPKTTKPEDKEAS